MVVLESLAAIVDNLEKELVCFRMHVPLFSELLIEISRDVNVDLNVVSEVLLGMLDHMQKHLTCCWKLLKDFYKKVAHSNLSSQIFGESEVGQMPEDLLEMLGSMTEHMVRFRRVCESRLKGQHCRGNCNSGYSRSLHLALTSSATTTDQAKKLLRPVSVPLLRLTSQDLDTQFGARCRLSPNSVTELREELKLGEMEALHRRIRSAALLWNKRRKAQLRSKRKLRLQKHHNKVDTRHKQTVAKISSSTRQPPPQRVTRRSVALAAVLEPVDDGTPGNPAQQPHAGGGSPKVSNKNPADTARRISVRRLTEACINDSPSARVQHEPKKRAYSHTGHRRVSATLRAAAGAQDKSGISGPASAGGMPRSLETPFSPPLRRCYATRLSTERSGLLSADRNVSPPSSTSGKGKRQLVPSTSNSLIGNKRRKSDSKQTPSRTKIRRLSLDADTNSIPRRSLRHENLSHSPSKLKILPVKRRIMASKVLRRNSSSAASSPSQPSGALSKSSHDAMSNAINSPKRRTKIARSSILKASSR